MTSQIWNTQGRQVDRFMLEYTAGEDSKLDETVFLPYDVRASRAHARMLQKTGVLSAVEARSLLEALDEILVLWEQGKFKVELEQEDGHTAIEAFLVKRCGEAGKKIHTARSRNDQSLTMIRLYMRDRAQGILKTAGELIRQWDRWIRKYGKTPMPGYTHLQKAMPADLGMWQGSFKEGLKDTSAWLKCTLAITDQSPLGTGAGYGIPLAIDRSFTAKELGFKKIQKNPMYAQLSRGFFESWVTGCACGIMTLLGRWAQDLLLFTTSEFSFFRLPDSLTTSSSIMPQKKNYDLLELLRAAPERVKAARNEIEGIYSRLGSGYQRDLQQIKGPLARALETTEKSLQMAIRIAVFLEPDAARLKSAMTADLYATDQVYRLVEKGVPFREAYARVKAAFRPEG